MDALDKLTAETGAPSRGQGVSPKAAALQGMPGEWRERLIAEAAGMGVRADDDLGWLLVASFINAWAGAAAAGKAAGEVSKGVATIPDQIYQGAVRAGADLQGVIESKGIEIGQALTVAVGKAGDGVVQRVSATMAGYQQTLSSAAADLTSKAEEAKSAILAQGVGEFAQAAQAAALSQMRAVTWRARVTGAILGAFLLVGAGIGGGVVADLDGHVTKYRIEQSGTKPWCGRAVVQGVGRQYICVLDAPNPSSKDSNGVMGFLRAWF